MSEFKLIDSAPKDGEKFLAFARGSSGSKLDTYYGECMWVSIDPDLNPLVPKKKLSFFHWEHNYIQPTHWRPLPEPPNE